MTNSRDAYDRFNKTTPVLSEKEQADVDALLLDFMIRKGWAVVEADGSITYTGIPEEAPKEVERIGAPEGATGAAAILATLPRAASLKDRVKALLLSDQFTTTQIVVALQCSSALVSIARRELINASESGLLPGVTLPESVVNARSRAFRDPEKRRRPDMVGMGPGHPMRKLAETTGQDFSSLMSDVAAHRLGRRYQPPGEAEIAARGDEIAVDRKRIECEERAAAKAVVPMPAKAPPKKRRGPRKPPPDDTTT